MNKQLKSPRLIILVMILSLMSVLVAGCGDDKYVQSVTYIPSAKARGFTAHLVKLF